MMYRSLIIIIRLRVSIFVFFKIIRHFYKFYNVRLFLIIFLPYYFSILSLLFFNHKKQYLLSTIFIFYLNVLYFIFTLFLSNRADTTEILRKDKGGGREKY